MAHGVFGLQRVTGDDASKGFTVDASVGSSVDDVVTVVEASGCRLSGGAFPFLACFVEKENSVGTASGLISFRAH